MASVNGSIRYVCPYGCQVKLSVPLRDVVGPDGVLSIDIDVDAFVLAQSAHINGMHS